MSDHLRGLANLARGDYWRLRASVVRVLDGDTIEVTLDLGYGLELRPVPRVYVTHVRFLGYDAPELTHQDGERARTALAELLYPDEQMSPRVWVKSAALDGRGRTLGYVELIDGRSVIDEMVKMGWLRPYDGRGPRPWS